MFFTPLKLHRIENDVFGSNKTMHWTI